MNRTLVAILVLACAVAVAVAIAVAQTGTIIIPTPAGSELISVIPTSPFPTGGNQSVYLTQVREAQGYSKQIPVTGATITSPANTSRLIVLPSGGLSALTINLPTGPTPGNHPVDGAEWCLWSSQNITTLTMQVSPSTSGETLNNPFTSWATSTNVNGPCWAFSASNKTWDRSQ